MLKAWADPLPIEGVGAPRGRVWVFGPPGEGVGGPPRGGRGGPHPPSPQRVLAPPGWRAWAPPGGFKVQLPLPFSARLPLPYPSLILFCGLFSALASCPLSSVSVSSRGLLLESCPQGPCQACPLPQAPPTASSSSPFERPPPSLLRKLLSPLPSLRFLPSGQ